MVSRQTSIIGTLLVCLQMAVFAAAASADGEPAAPPLTITSPFPGTVFPRDIAAPIFRWKGDSSRNGWHLTMRFAQGDPLEVACSDPLWQPDEALWETIKQRSLEKSVTVRVKAAGQESIQRDSVFAQSDFTTSTDPVGAPIFYRDVSLPFRSLLKTLDTIEWKLGWVSSPSPPPTVLKGMRMCANCHSFSTDGRVLAMDVDYGGDKGSYAIADVGPQVILEEKNLISWSDYRREDGDRTFGLLSSVSPDGRYVISTLKDAAVQLPAKGIAYSQLFFPIRGILVVYDRQKKTFKALPGADDPDFVQTNPTWSPDGQWVVFARAPADGIENIRERYVQQGKKFRYDLYRIPFNGGRGGTATPLPGASNNGKSNYFPKYSPDGKWIVFCQSESYMLLQADSALHLLPADGGKPRKMNCNIENRMNSWHSWSPNGRWMVFASKAGGPYTQLRLTHIDSEGADTPPVLLEGFVTPKRAANIPEFANIEKGELAAIHPKFKK